MDGTTQKGQFEAKTQSPYSWRTILRAHALGLSLGLLLMVIGFAGLDTLIDRMFDREFRSVQFQATMTSLRAFGEGPVAILIVLGIVRVKPSLLPEIAIGIVSVLLVVGTVDCTKSLVQRRRPIEFSKAYRPGKAVNSSFPSSHVATSFAIARVISLAVPATTPICLIAGSATAANRMFERKHFFSDCVAGAMLGWYFVSIFSHHIRRLAQQHHLIPQQEVSLTNEVYHARAA